ncbi:YibE/F family protein [Nocardioides sp.]|uniref:YibE/F family protein n=1 Tax=Nocardioides sp. TaxID=35761 RepID=UPI002732CAA6|nr:YibE/F family protein [Nocardioides sp.]MDP3889969.1 YibE/F family protein [Nocardioides sp.]
MSGSHSHSHATPPDVEVGRLPRLVLVTGIVLAAVATVIGVVVLWPSADARVPPVPYAAEGAETVSAEVVSLSEPCPVIAVDPAVPPTGEQPVFPENCNEATFSVEGESRDVTFQVPPNVIYAGLRAGDAVQLIAFPGVDGQVQYGFLGVDRDFPIALMALLFVIVTALVARLRGLLALLGLVIAGYVLAKFMLPALLAGESGFGVALAGSSLIMIVVLYLAHGVSIRTSAALGGTLIAVLITAVIGLWGVDSARLSGIRDDDAELLLLHAPDLSFPGLLASAMIIAGLGVLNDVTITQTSAVWELRAAAPEMSRRELFSSGMRIGRDHIASSIYTIVFAYAGTALVVLMLISLFDRPLLDLFVDESIGEEVVRTLASATGLVLAVPITTAIAALTVGGPVRSRAGNGARRA